MTDLPLEAATKDVIARYKRGDDMLASAAVALRRLKERVDAGEAGEVGWDEYRHTYLEPHMSRKWINKQLQLAPPNATEDEVARNTEEHRKRQLAHDRKYKEKLKIQKNNGDSGARASATADDNGDLFPKLSESPGPISSDAPPPKDHELADFNALCDAWDVAGQRARDWFLDEYKLQRVNASAAA